MATQHPLFQITSFVDDVNVNTFTDRSCITRNPRCGQWLRLSWCDRRSRFIGVSRGGALVIDHTSGGNFKKFSEKVRAFKKANSRQTSFDW